MLCLACGYALDGLRSFRCPECGRGFDPRDRASYGPPAGRLLTHAEARWLTRLYWMLSGLALGAFGPYLHYALAWLALGRQPMPSADDPKFIPGIGWARDAFLVWTIGALPSAIAAATIPLVIAAKSARRPTTAWWLTRAILPLLGVAFLVLFKGRVIVWFAD